MNRMWVRLSLAFTAVIMITMITVSGVVRFAMETKPSYQENIPEPVKEFFEERGNYEPPINITTFLLIVGTVAIIAGVGMSRNMTKPLRELEETVEHFGPQNLNQRVLRSDHWGLRQLHNHVQYVPLHQVPLNP